MPIIALRPHYQASQTRRETKTPFPVLGGVPVNCHSLTSPRPKKKTNWHPLRVRFRASPSLESSFKSQDLPPRRRLLMCYLYPTEARKEHIPQSTKVMTTPQSPFHRYPRLCQACQMHQPPCPLQNLEDPVLCLSRHPSLSGIRPRDRKLRTFRRRSSRLLSEMVHSRFAPLAGTCA